MSLSEALLLDPYKLDVWIAARTDGVKGSGTQSDPWDGSTRSNPAVPVQSLTKGVSDPQEITASASNHGFAEGDQLTILGVALGSANRADVYYTGTFSIYSVTASSFKYRNLYGAPSSATAPRTITCVREREQFDTLMRGMPPNTTIHLGAGVFETKGVAPLSVVAWEAQSGQKLRGSGIGVTTLKLVGAAAPDTQYWAVGIYPAHYLEDFEVSDLTIDCNVAGQTSPLVACGATNIPGKHIRIRRIRAVNFGSHSPNLENFVVTSGATHVDLDANGYKAVDCVIEDCIAEHPSPDAVVDSVFFHFFAGERPNDGWMAFYSGSTIRNCFADGRIHYGPVVPVDTINYDGTYVTVTTKAPHLRTVPGNVLVQGVTVSGSANTLFNGVFAIDQVVSDTVLKYRLSTTGTPSAQNATVGGGVSTHPVAIESITPDDTLDVCPFLALYAFQIYEPVRTYILKTREPHNRTTTNNVSVWGVLRPNPLNPTQYISSTAFNGAFALDEYIPSKPTQLQYTLLQDPDDDAGRLSYVQAFVNTFHQALSAGGGRATVVNGNRVFHCTVGGPYHDTWQSGDSVVCDNYYHDVLAGPFENLGGISSNPNALPLDSLGHVGTTAVATTSIRHGLGVGDRVTVSGATGSDATLYNGTWPITAVPDSKTFSYGMNGTPAASASGAGYSTLVIGPPLVSGQKRLQSLDRIVVGTPPNAQYFAKATIKSEYAWFKHGLLPGDAVAISFAGHWDKVSVPESKRYNGNLVVTNAPAGSPPPGDTTFYYQLPDDPVIDASNSNFAAGYFGRIWQAERLVIEKNVVEVGVRALNSDWGHASGIPVYGYRSFSPAYPIVEALVRDNVIRNVNDETSPSNRAIEMWACQWALAENNVTSLDRTTPIEHFQCGSTHTFNNTTVEGQLIISYSWDTPTPVPATDVVTKVRADLEDALLSWFLEE